MVVLILMGRIIWKAVTFILNLLHLIRVEWWMEGSAYSQSLTTPPDSQISFPLKQPQCFCVVSGTVSPHSFISANLKMNEDIHIVLIKSKVEFIETWISLRRFHSVQYCKTLEGSGFTVSRPKKRTSTFVVSAKKPQGNHLRPSVNCYYKVSQQQHLSALTFSYNQGQVSLKHPCTALSSSKLHCKIMCQHDLSAKCF